MVENDRPRSLRLFVACLLPEEALAALANAQRQLREAGAPHLRWVRPEGIHLTLKFLGEVPSVRVLTIEDALRRATQDVPSFDLALNTLGTFRGRGGPRVLWASLAGDLERLSELQHRVEAAMATLDFAREDRPFQPHLTLARLPDELPIVERQKIEPLVQSIELPKTSIPVSQVSLMRSILDRGGAIYHELASFPLGS